jgi:hypothetical protein
LLNNSNPLKFCSEAGTKANSQSAQQGWIIVCIEFASCATFCVNPLAGTDNYLLIKAAFPSDGEIKIKGS